MNVAEVKSRVMRTFGDESGAQVTSEDIIRWINDGQMEIARSNHLLEQKATADVILGQDSYAYPVDTLEIWALRYDNYKIRVLSMEQADEYITNFEDSKNYQQGIPQVYWAWEDTLYLYPVPDRSITAGLTIYYSKVPQQVAGDADVPELPLKYHPRIVDYCLKQAYELDEDYNASSLKEAQLNNDLENMLNSEKWTTQDFYPVITVRHEDL
jgi:hypothetical protein